MYKIWRILLKPFRRYDCGHRNWKWVMWLWPRPVLSGGLSFVFCKPWLDIVYLCAKRDDLRLQPFQRYGWWPPKFKGFTWPLTSDHASSGTVCHPWASTCYDQRANHIWSVYLHPVWRYERWYKMWKMVWFGAVRGRWRSLEIAPFDNVHMSSY